MRPALTMPFLALLLAVFTACCSAGRALARLSPQEDEIIVPPFNEQQKMMFSAILPKDRAILQEKFLYLRADPQKFHKECMESMRQLLSNSKKKFSDAEISDFCDKYHDEHEKQERNRSRKSTQPARDLHSGASACAVGSALLSALLGIAN